MTTVLPSSQSNTGTSPSGPPTRWLRALAALAQDIKLSHSVFALPFALLATFLAAAHHGNSPGAITLSLIVLCMVLARTMAMSVNRLVDASLDAQNPRTRNRAIPSGRLSRRFVAAVAGMCAGGFVLACSGFWFYRANPWPLVLSPLVVAWLSLYSFSKRFTSLSHLWLGSSLALSPIGAAVAVEPDYLQTAEPYLLAIMVMLWVAGFDVIYALQDVEVDRQMGLYSLPARWGVEPALWLSRTMHAGALLALISLWLISPCLKELFGLGLVLTAGLLILEHALVWGSKLHHLQAAFFTVNGLISLLLGGLGIADVWRSLMRS